MSDYTKTYNEQPDFDYLGTPSYPYQDSSCIALPNAKQLPPNYQNKPRQLPNQNPFIGPQKNHQNRKYSKRMHQEYEQMLRKVVQEIKAAAPIPQPTGIDSVQFNKRQREQFREVWRLVLRDNITPEQAAMSLGYDPYNFG
jgi:hypothetical protein